MGRNRKWLFILCAFWLFLSGPSRLPAARAEAQNAWVDTGDVPERVIALSKSNAELWVLAGGSLIAASQDALVIEGLNEDVIDLGDMDHVSLEMTAALEPDLLILFSTDPAQKALGEAAESIGLRVYYTNIDGFSDYEAVMDSFTRMTGREDLFRENVLEVRRQMDEILEEAAKAPGSGTYLLLHVSATRSKAEKNDYFACEILNNLGLVNIAADGSAWNELSMEAVAAADPDYIFVVPRGDEEKALASYRELFSSNPSWQQLGAVRNDRTYLLPKELFGLKPNAEWAEAYRLAYDLVQ